MRYHFTLQERKAEYVNELPSELSQFKSAKLFAIRYEAHERSKKLKQALKILVRPELL